MKISSLSLIVANIIPLLGAIFFDWNIFEIMIFFWAETAIIGFYFVLKIIFIVRFWSIIFVPLIVFGISAFMFIHLMMINLISVFPQMQIYYQQVITNLNIVFANWEIVLLPLFISHGLSFVFNFLVNKEYLKYRAENSLDKLNTNVFTRIMLMQAALIFGFMLSLLVDKTFVFIFILFGIKIYIDLKLHKKEHENA